MVPLQVPGGPELLVLGLIFLILLAGGIVVIGAIAYLVRRGSGNPGSEQQRLAELEQRVAELEEKLDSGNDSGE